jgi:IclR family acetate operon transcriptional repressor
VGQGNARVQSVERAAQLLMLVARGTTNGTGKELAQELGLAVPTAHHLLTTLVAEGLLARTDHARYVLGPQIAMLADAFYREGSPPEALVNSLRQLASSTNETSYVAAWRGSEIRMLASVEGEHALRVSVPTGRYTDAHARATGKALLAFARDEARDAYLRANPLRPLTPHTIIDLAQFLSHLDEIRGQGYAIDEEEFQAGVCCVSAPVLSGGFAIAAFTVSVPASRFAEKRSSLTEAVRAVAESVERSLSSS